MRPTFSFPATCLAVIALLFALNVSVAQGSGRSAQQEATTAPLPNKQLVIINPDVNLDTYKIWKASDRRNDPRSQEPSYIYLVINQDAVRLIGPKLARAAGTPIKQLFKLENPMIREIRPTPYSARGMYVRVNERLAYRIRIKDYEYEIALAKVNLVQENHKLKSRFVFAATGDGVAWHITIETLVDGVMVDKHTPFTIESRRH